MYDHMNNGRDTPVLCSRYSRTAIVPARIACCIHCTYLDGDTVTIILAHRPITRQLSYLSPSYICPTLATIVAYSALSEWRLADVKLCVFMIVYFHCKIHFVAHS